MGNEPNQPLSRGSGKHWLSILPCKFQGTPKLCVITKLPKLEKSVHTPTEDWVQQGHSTELLQKFQWLTFENYFARNFKGNGLYLLTRMKFIYLKRHFQIKSNVLKWDHFYWSPKSKINGILSIKMHKSIENAQKNNAGNMLHILWGIVYCKIKF